MFLKALTLLLALTQVRAGTDCWTTGCQPDSWATVGCEQYAGYYTDSKSTCTESGQAGHTYKCCKPEGTTIAPISGPGQASSITWEEFSKAVTSNPAGESWKWAAPSRAQYDTFMKSVTSKGAIVTKEEAAMALANFLQESDGLTAKKEYACESDGCPSHYRTPGCDVSGKFYFGRGYIQLTWCYNYRDASMALYNDLRLVNDPDSVSNSEQLCWDTAFWYWKTKVHTAPGVSEGKFGATIKAINGGLECGASPPHPEKAARRKRIYSAIRSAFNLAGAGDLSGC